MCVNRNLRVSDNEFLAQESEKLTMEATQAILVKKGQIQARKIREIDQISSLYKQEIAELEKQLPAILAELDPTELEATKSRLYKESSVLAEQMQKKLQLIDYFKAEHHSTGDAAYMLIKDKTPETILQHLVTLENDLQTRINDINDEIQELRKKWSEKLIELREVENKIVRLKDSNTMKTYLSIADKTRRLENALIKQIKEIEHKYAAEELTAFAEIKSYYHTKQTDLIVKFKYEAENWRRRNEFFSSVAQMQAMPSADLSVRVDFINDEVVIWSTQALSLEQHNLLDEAIQETLAQMTHQHQVTIQMVGRDCYSIVFNDPKTRETYRKTFYNLAKEISQTFAAQAVVPATAESEYGFSVPHTIEIKKSSNADEINEDDVEKAMQTFLTGVAHGTLSPGSIFSNSQQGWIKRARTGDMRFDPKPNSPIMKR